MTRSAKVRFIAKPRVNGRVTTWWVYDREGGCNPVSIPGFGQVKTDMDTETEAQAEADRVAAHFEKD